MPAPKLTSMERFKLERNLAYLQERIRRIQALVKGSPITTARIANAAITSAKIQDLAVLSAKISDLSADKITAGDFLDVVDIGDEGSGFTRFDSANSRILIHDGTNNRIVIDPEKIRVSLPTFDALTETNIDNYALYTDSDNVLIKEFSRGSATVSANSSTNISHVLGYIPMVLVYAEAADGTVGTSGRWFHVAGVDSQAIVGIEVSTSNLILINQSPSTSKNFKYYIFYDQQV